MADLIASPITIATFESLLESRGWIRVKRNERRAIWSNGESGIFVPQRVGFDFAPVMERAIEQFQDHRQTEIDVRWHLEWPTWDRLQSRVSDHGYLGLRELVERQRALLDVVEYTAWSRVTPDRKSFGGGAKPKAVREYVDSARATPSVHGSFLLRAILPLRSPAHVVPGDRSDFRSFSAAIPHVLSGATGAARDVQRGASTRRWDQAFEQNGVTANVCDALARHVGHVSDDDRSPARNVRISLDLSVSPGRLFEAVEAPRRVIVDSSLVPILEVGRSVLRGEPEEQTIQIDGLVTKLERRLQTGPGLVTITGNIKDLDMKERSIRIEMDEASYHDALEAHDEGSKVKARLEVVRRRTRIDVKRMVGFDLSDATATDNPSVDPMHEGSPAEGRD